MISVVVPTLNEEARLSACLEAFTCQEQVSEIIVVDGGSTDRTVGVARDHGTRVLTTAPGRARQLNAGARAASDSMLLFVHADTIVPPDAALKIERAAVRGAHAGAFTLRFDVRRPAWTLAAWMSDVYCRWSGDLFGDRAMFVARPAFEAVGGFRELPLMEDLDLTVRLRNAGYRTTLLRGPVVTSARRFVEAGIWRGAWRALRLTRAFHRGGGCAAADVAMFSELKR